MIEFIETERRQNERHTVRKSEMLRVVEILNLVEGTLLRKYTVASAFLFKNRFYKEKCRCLGIRVLHSFDFITSPVKKAVQ